MTNAVQLSELRVAASMDASGFAKGAAEIDGAAKKAGAATKGLGDVIVQTESVARKGADGFERLKRQFIDGYGTAQQFEAKLALLNKGLDRGKISAEEAEQALIGLNRQYGLTGNSAELAAKGQHQLAAAVDRANATIARTPALMRAANDNMAQYRRQNLGMQLGDTAQSLALGAPLSMVALQQGPQIAQLYMAQGGLNQAMRDFGVILTGVARVAGPVIGALGALYGGYKLLESFSVSAGLAISNTTRELAAQAAPLGTVSGMVSELEKLQAEYNKTIANSGRASDTATSLILANTKMEYDARKQLLALELDLQEARLATQRADMTIAGQSMRERVASQLSNDPSRAVREGYADPAINGGLPFVRLPDEISGTQKALDAVSTDPANRELAKMRAEAALTTLEINKMREALAKPFDTSGDPLADSFWSRFSQAQLAKQKAMQDAQNPVPAFPNGVPIPQMRPMDGGDPTTEDARIQKRIDLLHKEAGARRDLAALVTAGANFDQGQQNELAALAQRARVIGLSADAAARSNAIFQAEQQMRQAGLSTIGAEADARRNLAAATATYAQQVQRSEQAYQSWQQAGSSAIDALTTSTGSFSDRLKGAADAMLSWITQMALANPLKNAMFGTNLPTLADLGKPASPLGGMTSTGTMSVTAGVVNVGGATLPGIPGATQGGGLADLLGYKPAAANPTAPGANSLGSVIANAGTTRTGIPLSSVTAGSLSAPVNAQYAGNFQGFLNELRGTGYNVESLGGYNYRNIRGTNTLSNHAFGNAIDINPATNPDGKTLITDMPPNVSQMASKYGLEWGGDWTSKKDAMHFEVAKGAQPMALDQASTNLKALSTATTTATKDISGLADSSQTAGEGLMSILGGKGPGAFPPAPAMPTTSPNFFPPAPAAPSGNPFAALFSWIPKLFGFADGTDFAPGGVAMVGERGPELIHVPRGSQVTPTHKLQGPNSEERMRMGGRTKVDVGVSVDSTGELKAYVKSVAHETSAAYTRAGIAAYDSNVLANRMMEVSENPWDRG